MWDNPQQTIVFETEDGFRFTRKTREIPWQVQNTVVDTFDTVKAEVEENRMIWGMLDS